MNSIPYTLRAVARQSPSSPSWLREDALVEVGSVLAEDARAALQGLQAGQGRPALPKLQPGRRYLLRVGDLAVSLDGGEPGDLARTAEHAAAHARDHADQAYGKKIPTFHGTGGKRWVPDADLRRLWVCAHVSVASPMIGDPMLLPPKGPNDLYTCAVCGHPPMTCLMPGPGGRVVPSLAGP